MGIGYVALGLTTIHIGNHSVKEGDRIFGVIALFVGIIEMFLGAIFILSGSI